MSDHADHADRDALDEGAIWVDPTHRLWLASASPGPRGDEVLLSALREWWGAWRERNPDASRAAVLLQAPTALRPWLRAAGLSALGPTTWVTGP